MKLDKKDLVLYGVTDRKWLDGRKLVDDVEKSLKGGVTILQLREKHLDDEEFLKEALEIKKICEKYKVPFIVNDNVEIAIKSNAHGIHVGQKDMVAKDVRKLIGENKILGVSAQTVEQALLAEKMGADYLGVGAIFSTDSKSDAESVDISTLKEICERVKIPVVAIGGIGKENVSLLENSGIVGVAVISAIYGENNIEVATTQLKDIVKKVVKEN